MKEEFSKEDIAKLQAYLKELRSNRFSLSDIDAIKQLAQKMAVTQSGWLDIDIFIKAQPAEAFTSYPDNFFLQYDPECYRLLRSIPRHFWFVITIPEGVNLNDPFISSHQQIHFENMENLRQLVLKLGGEILYYEIDSQCILGIVKILQPIEDNAKQIQQAIQNSINYLFHSFYGIENTAWRVSLRWIEEYDDIRVTLQNRNEYMK